MNSKISDKDKKDWNDFLSSDEKLSDKDLLSIWKKKRREIVFDLHGLSLDDANKKIFNLINDAYNNEVGKITIVTGKGLHSQNDKDPYVSKDFGILKNSVPDYIQNNAELMKLIKDIRHADINDGGSGAFYIFLKKRL